MTESSGFYILCFCMMFLILGKPCAAQLSDANYYANTCPRAYFIIRNAVTRAVYKEHRMGASLLRLHFHDCFVNGCDASVLLDDTSSLTGEKTAGPNAGSLRGFEVIDQIKSELESACPGVVSCADLLAISARDSVFALGGPSWTVQLGRKDSTTASLSDANSEIPSPAMDLDGLISSFVKKGFTAQEMVALSGKMPHVSKQDLQRDKHRINIGKFTEIKLSQQWWGQHSLPLDATSQFYFDNAYFKNLVDNKGLLHSDQQLFSGGSTDAQVTTYSTNSRAFFEDFGTAMVKMGSLSPLTGTSGQIRTDCRKVN